MAGTIVRGSDTVATVKPQGFTFNPSPQTYNFNAFVASS
jgi:glucan endo-1,3-alpha-glucosidase